MLINATRICEANFGALFRFEDGAVRAAAMLNVPPPYAEFWQRGPRRPDPRTALARVMETRQVVHVADVRTHPAYVEGERTFIALVNLGGFRTLCELLRMSASYGASHALTEWVRANPIAPGRQSVSARAALERRTVQVPDVQADPEYSYAVRDLRPIRTSLAVPMLKGDVLVGVIVIYRLEVKPF